MARQYSVGAFAARSGVSVRTLHHYDRIGLLRPAARTASGHRRYTDADLLTLQQIRTLRYLGFSLRQIAALLHREDFHLRASMRVQHALLRQRLAELERVAQALEALLAEHEATGRWAWDRLAGLVAAVETQLTARGAPTMEQHYTPEQLARWRALDQQVPAEERAAIEREWAELLAAVRASQHLDPASPEAQALVDRWDRAMATLRDSYERRGFGDLLAAVGERYRQGAFEGSPEAPQAADFAFIERARRARRGDTR
jgi:DNA-binding transcriptional MerR regulator